MLGSLKRSVREFLDRRRFAPIVFAVRDDRLTYLDAVALNDLHERVGELERDCVQGAIVEAGCALGGSAIVLAKAKSPTRPMYVYDVFGMIPPPSAQDGEDVHKRYEVIKEGKSTGIDGDAYYGYEENLLEKVRDNFRRYGVATDANSIHLVKGLFQDTMHLDEPVALAHLDGDWYESVMTCLQRLAPKLARGGVLVIDDYDAWSGCRTAVDEYFKDKRDAFDFQKRSRLHIVRR